MTNDNAAPASEPAIPNPRADIAQLNALERTLYCHRYAIDEISSLGPVIDPAKATAERGEAVALLEQERVEALCAPEVGPLLDRIEQSPELMGQTRLAQARVIRRDRASLIDVPAEEQAAFTRLTTEANDVWRRAKAANDWASFEPYLDRIVEAMRHMAQAKNAEKDPYDVWLDEFEHGTSRAFYDPFFAQVKDCVVPLLADCMASRHKPDHKVMDGKFDVERQWALAGDLMRLEGVDEDALWLGRTEHPFTGGPGVGFVLIASHVYEDNVLSNVFSMLHEGGHTLYEQNVDPAYAMTSLKGGTSMGMHEAQSRFFENIVGRSEAFAGPLLEVLQRRFPGQLGRVTPHQLYLAENCAEPCLIRCDADELTYPLHILIRYELEQMLFSARPRRPISPRSGRLSTRSTWASTCLTTPTALCRTPTGLTAAWATSPPTRWAAPLAPSSRPPWWPAAWTLTPSAPPATSRPSASGCAPTSGTGAAPRTPTSSCSPRAESPSRLRTTRTT